MTCVEVRCCAPAWSGSPGPPPALPRHAPPRLRRRQRLPGRAARTGGALRRLLRRASRRRSPNPSPSTPTTPDGSRNGSPSHGVERRLDHWRHRLTPLPVLSLRSDHPRPTSPRFRGGVIPLSVPRETRPAPPRLGPERRSDPLPGAGDRLVPAPRPILGPGRRRLRHRRRPAPATGTGIGGRLLPDALGPADRPERRPLLHRSGGSGAQRAARRPRPPRAVRTTGPRTGPRRGLRTQTRSTRP